MSPAPTRTAPPAWAEGTLTNPTHTTAIAAARRVARARRIFGVAPITLTQFGGAGSRPFRGNCRLSELLLKLALPSPRGARRSISYRGLIIAAMDDTRSALIASDIVEGLRDVIRRHGATYP